MKKIKLMSSISMFILSIACLAIGVYSATQASFAMTGSINFEANGIFAGISGSVKTSTDGTNYVDSYDSGSKDFAEAVNFIKDVDGKPNGEASTTSFTYAVADQSKFNENGWNLSGLALTEEAPYIQIQLTIKNYTAFPVAFGVTENLQSGDSIEITSKAPDGTIPSMKELTPGQAIYTITLRVTNFATSINGINFSTALTLSKANDEVNAIKGYTIRTYNTLGNVSKYECKPNENEGYLFSNWSDGNTTPEYVTTTAGLTANYMMVDFTNYTGLTFTLNPGNESYSVKKDSAFKDYDSISYFAIPSTYNGKPVTKIANSAFYSPLSSITIKKVIIQEGITSIGEKAFSGYKGLNTITIPSTVNSIGNSAFKDCNSLISVAIPEGVAQIGDMTFYSCSNLTTVTIPSSVKSIGANAFNFCNKLNPVTIPEGIESIGDKAFNACKALTEVTIPSSIESIGNNVFSYCSNLKSVTIPSSVNSIGLEAFRECSSLTSVTIPEGVTSISEKSFYECTRLTSVSNPSTILIIGKEAFRGCIGLTSVTIPEGVTGIGDRAFYSCSSLNSLTIPSTLTNMGEQAFSGCIGLISITIQEGATSIGADAFHNCSTLTSITIPSSVQSIGYGAFGNCGSLNTITVASNNTKYHSAGNCIIETATKTLIMGCKNTVIPTDGSVTSIGEKAFYYLSGLTTITIPSSITSIGANAFSGWKDLTQVTIPSGVSIIETSAFQFCSDLTSLTISEGVTSIKKWAFSGCSKLTQITIPSSVQTIENYAFSNCTSLNSVTFADPNGWQSGTSPLNLSNPTQNATNLISTYSSETWTRI